jgi:hypothetical protein
MPMISVLRQYGKSILAQADQLFPKKEVSTWIETYNIPDGEDSNDRIRSVARTTARSGRLFSSYPGERPSGRRRFDGRFGVAMRFEHELDPLPPRTVEDVVRRTGTNLMDGHVQNLFDGLERRTVVKHHGTRLIISTSRIIGHDSSPKTDLMINRFALISLLLPEGIDGRWHQENSRRHCSVLRWMSHECVPIPPDREGTNKTKPTPKEEKKKTRKMTRECTECTATSSTAASNHNSVRMTSEQLASSS